MPRPPSIEPGTELAQRLEATVVELGSRRKAAAALALTIGAVNRYFARQGAPETAQRPVEDHLPAAATESIQGYPMNDGIPHERISESTQVCGAKTRHGSSCQRAAGPNGRCNLHGGKALAGAASPRFKSGDYSAYMPERLRERFAAAQDDPELLSVRDDIALARARITDLLERVDSGEAGTLWRQAGKLLRDFHRANGREDAADRQMAILAELEQTVGEGVNDYAAWDEVLKQQQLLLKLSEAERKRLVELQQVMTVEQAMVLLAQITDIVQRHVTDRTTRAAIAAEFVRLTGRGPGRVLDVSGGGA